MLIVGVFMAGIVIGILILTFFDRSSENEKVYTEKDLTKYRSDITFWYKEWAKLNSKVKYWKGFGKL